jgi:hypothetical protein
MKHIFYAQYPFSGSLKIVEMITEVTSSNWKRYKSGGDNRANAHQNCYAVTKPIVFQPVTLLAFDILGLLT